MNEIISVDIETTGLDPQKDAIIEIGAVKFSNKRIIAEWTTLINPGRTIPISITQLTGITDQMVMNSPSIRDVIQEFHTFVGDNEIIGHNIRFDLSFLRRFSKLDRNIVTDTYELSTVLLPTNPRYSLGSLAYDLGVLLPATHRALDDARATRGVFLRLQEIASQLPLEIIADIVHQSEGLDWDAHWFFRQILRERKKEIAPSHENKKELYIPDNSDYLPTLEKPLQPREHPVSLNVEDVSSYLEFGGTFSKEFPNFEFRSQQVEMLKSITKAISTGKHLLVEAGTGTGKSMAYLVPAALWAWNNEYRVVISTNTINLQDQLIKKDIPDLKKAIKMDLRTAIVKGRANYLCPKRLENLRKRGPENVDEMRLLAKVIIWLQITTTGDRAELNLNNPSERYMWMRISAEDEGCSADNCMNRVGGNCPFFRTHLSAQSAHLIIVNHALLLADVATGNRVLPPYDYLIIDEAHHLEDATTNALSYHLTQTDYERMLRELGGPNAGILGRILNITQGLISPSDFASLNQLIQKITDTTFRLQNCFQEFFNCLEDFLLSSRNGKEIGQYGHQERITPSTRTMPAWSEVEASWDETEQFLLSVKGSLEKLLLFLGELFNEIIQEEDDIYSNLGQLIRRFNELYENIHALVLKPDYEKIYWLEIRNDNKGLSLHVAPLHIGTLMQKYFWHEKASIIMTSATLTTAGDFNYIRGRLLAQEADEQALGSPFDYENSTLVYLVKDIPEPVDRYGYQKAVEYGLTQICKATGGKAMVLFTSYDQLKKTARAIAPSLAKENILLYEQGEGASAHSLLESFKIAERAVLLGTRAFWEGVDIPGAALSLLVISKLPFDVPSDPIIASRAETFDDPFNEYSLPEAILRFRQGFGRLIRTQYDRGAVVILDRRILSKRYGRFFIDSLPPCTFKEGQLKSAPSVIQKWLNF